VTESGVHARIQAGGVAADRRWAKRCGGGCHTGYSRSDPTQPAQGAARGSPV